MHAKTCPLALLVLSLGSQAVAQEPPMLQITHHPARDWHPTWSPDGTQIAFMSNRFANSQEIMVVPAIFGGQPVRLFHNFASPTVDAPAWSPNGDVIAFHSRIPSCFCYVIAGATVPGGDTYSILSCCGPNNFNPSWSPDGTQIVFQSDRPEGDAVFDLFVVPATGGPDTQITFGNLDNTEPEWSPDGTQIAFVSRRAGTQDIWLMPATGGPATQLTDYPSSERWPTWSPDGTQIAFARSMDDNMDVWVVPAERWATHTTHHPSSGRLLP